MTGNEPNGEMVRARVLEAEIVKADGPSTPGAAGTAVARWQQVTVLPPTWRARWAARWGTRALARQTVRDAVARVLRAPWRAVTAVARGVVHAARAWRRWVRVHDYREAAEQAEKLADKFVEIRALTLLRWKVTVTVLGASGIGVAIAASIYGPRVWWVLGGALAAVLAWVGRRRDGAPGRTAVLAGPRSLTWTEQAG
jgi:S-DNA-T family DNA segregation ATPase FtsK/SpoIIIE